MPPIIRAHVAGSGTVAALKVAVQFADTPLPGGLDEQAMHADWPDTDA